MKTAIAWFARNSVAANLLMLVILVAGALTLPRVKMEIFPAVEADLVVVSVPTAAPPPVKSRNRFACDSKNACRPSKVWNV